MSCQANRHTATAVQDYPSYLINQKTKPIVCLAQPARVVQYFGLNG
jgi:hypothetical protein